MYEIITINKKHYVKISYKDEPIVSLPMIAEMQDRSYESIQKNFQDNIGRLRKGKDYFKVPYEEWKLIVDKAIFWVENRLLDELEGDRESPSSYQVGTDPLSASILPEGYRGEMIFLTMIGCGKLIQSLDDDLAWRIYIDLVKHHFSYDIPLYNKNRLKPVRADNDIEQRLLWTEYFKFEALVKEDVEAHKKTDAYLQGQLSFPLLLKVVEKIYKVDPKVRDIFMVQRN